MTLRAPGKKGLSVVMTFRFAREVVPVAGPPSVDNPAGADCVAVDGRSVV